MSFPAQLLAWGKKEPWMDPHNCFTCTCPMVSVYCVTRTISLIFLGLGMKIVICRIHSNYKCYCHTVSLQCVTRVSYTKGQLSKNGPNDTDLFTCAFEPSNELYVPSLVPVSLRQSQLVFHRCARRRVKRSICRLCIHGIQNVKVAMKPKHNYYMLSQGCFRQ